MAFASQTLSPSERTYAQLEKEALALVYGVQHFHQFLYGRRFTLVTDHKPLTTILNPRKGIPSLAVTRLQRWAIILSAYQYKYTQDHSNTDGLSRLPLPTVNSPKGQSPHVDVFNVGQLDSLPVTAQQLGQATRKDVILSKVWRYSKLGWPQKAPDYLCPYWNRRNELTLEGDCLMWGIRVVVPRKLQDSVLHELHREHQGIARMKANARSYI